MPQAQLIKKQYIPSTNDVRAYIGLEHIEQQNLKLISIGSSEDIDSNKFEFKAGQILFGKLRPYFRKVYRPKFDGVCSTDIWVIDSRSQFDNGFLFYFLADQRIINEANNSSEGTKMPRARWDYLSRLKFAFPSISEQRAIASILSSLDDKIALNRSMNSTLEAIGQALFKHWFVDFEFPDEEGKPYRSSGGEMAETELGEVPRGWEVMALSKIAEFTRGFSYAGSEKSKVAGDYVFVTLNSVYEGGGFKREFSYLTSERLKERHLVKEGEIIIANTEQTKTGTLLGFPALVEFPPNYDKKVGVFSHHITKVIPFGEEFKHFLYYYLNFYQANAVKYHTGSVIWALDVNGWTNNEKIMLPKKEILITFSELMNRLFQRRVVNNRESSTLEDIRDSLLPKLMSGEIRVKIDREGVRK